jgi:AcrR family transcriptional regulator
MTMSESQSRKSLSPRRSQAQRSAATKARILSATVKILSEKGYSAASVKMIAAETGVSVGALQYQFSSKSKLMAAVIDQLLRRRISTYRAALAGITDPRRRLDALRAAGWEIARHPEFAAAMEVVLARRSDPDLRRETERPFRRSERLLERWTALLVKASGQDVAEMAIARRLYSAFVYGLALRQASGLDPDTDELIRYWDRAWAIAETSHPFSPPRVEGDVSPTQLPDNDAGVSTRSPGPRARPGRR